ncbi:phage replication protein [Stutzerimonas nosocomialis]|uniref:replication protein n=1 Tax=Stutzerimonas nosocomialis TaxID=1056496 RepID=UPI00110945FA|nr:replication protein [Stutzerimonas nosocomialis]TLX53818.1 phage replication protein [Stutzerimonas nosocomialis]
MDNVIQIGNTQRGFTRMDNSIMDALMAIDLPARELKVALFVAKATINFQAGPVRISAAEVSKATNIHPDVASRAISHLLKRRVIFREGGARGSIGLCDPKEWVYYECPNRTNKSDSDQSADVIEIASRTKTDDSLPYSKNLPLVTVPSEQITAPQGGEPAQVEKDSGVSFNGEDFQVSSDLITKWAKAYAPVDVETEIVRAAAWASANRPKKDWRRFLVKWLGSAHRKAAGNVNEAGVPVDQIIDLYHRVCPNLPAVTVKADKALRSMIVERWNEAPAHQSGKGFWLPFFEKANNRSQVFYRGQNVVPRLEALVSRAVFREISEAQQ